MRKTLILAAVLAAVATPAFAEKTAPAAKIFMFLDKFLKTPAVERDRMTLSYGVRKDGKRIPNLKATLVEKSGVRTPMPVNAEGEFERLPTLAQLQGDATLVFDVPADWKLGTSLNIRPQLKPAPEYEAGELAATIDQSNAVIGKAAGMMSFMAPKMVGIAFMKAEGGTIVFADGHTTPLPNTEGEPYFLPADHKGAVRVKLTKTPTRVAFYQGKK